MKKLLLSIVLLVFAAPVFAADFLVCDLPPADVNVTQSQVEVTKKPGPNQTVEVVPGLIQRTATDFLLLDVSSFAADQYAFRARWADDGGWWSDWSDATIKRKITPPKGKTIR